MEGDSLIVNQNDIKLGKEFDKFTTIKNLSAYIGFGYGYTKNFTKDLFLNISGGIGPSLQWQFVGLTDDNKRNTIVTTCGDVLASFGWNKSDWQFGISAQVKYFHNPLQYLVITNLTTEGKFYIAYRIHLKKPFLPKNPFRISSYFELAK
jgi:hypothetical protein